MPGPQDKPAKPDEGKPAGDRLVRVVVAEGRSDAADLPKPPPLIQSEGRRPTVNGDDGTVIAVTAKR